MITIEQLETMRKNLKKKYQLFIVLGIIYSIICVMFAFALQSEVPFIFITVGIVVIFIIATIITSTPAREYNLAFKDYFVKSSLTEKFTDLKYMPESGLPRHVIASTNMMYMGDRYASNDLITAKYKNIDFTQADVHIEEEHETTDSDGNTRTYYVTIFKGRWMIFDFNKTFKANIQVCQKGFGNNKVNTWFSKNKFERVEMESQEFNKAFNVYAQLPLEAFYILTPKMMERIKHLDEKNDGRLLLCFIDNKLHVGIYDHDDSFEHGSVFRPINEQQVRSKISTDIEKITMFVDEMELDNDLFKK